MAVERGEDRLTREVSHNPLKVVDITTDLSMMSANVYSANSKGNGCRGSDFHEQIVDWLRFELPAYMREYIPARFYMMPDILLEMAQGNRGKGHRVDMPDANFVFADGVLLVEVGQCFMSKWPDNAVLHISFDGEVSLWNERKGTQYAHDVLQVASMNLGMPFERPAPRPLPSQPKVKPIFRGGYGAIQTEMELSRV